MATPIDGSKPHFPQDRLVIDIHQRFSDLAEHLREKLPFPFSGVVLFEVGDGPAIQASHFPGQANFPPSTPMNSLSIGKLFTAIAIMQLMNLSQ